MRTYAIYLPAFHEVEINNRTWGKGFTEWDNVRKGTPLFKGHQQPVEPLDDNYYNLSKKNDIERQIDLANDFGVEGFIFYHYWFGNGHMALEKPAEILRDEIDKKINYCFCWANHSWYTTWHGKSSEVIENQIYSDDEDNMKHIEYFYSFFKDDRYLKINNRPVLFIYNMSDIPDFKHILSMWNSFLKENGMENIYIIEYISSKNRDLSFEGSDGVTEFEPLYTTYFDISKVNLFKRFINKKTKTIDFQNYNSLWNKIINRTRTYNHKEIFKGCFVGWDNSPRKGKNSMIVKGGTPENFKANLRKLVTQKRKDSNNDFIIINAWNEWSEGAMLEPSKQYGHGYLEAIKEINDETK